MKNNESIYLINIGNTHSQFVNFETKEEFIIPTDDILSHKFHFSKQPTKLFIASVVPSATKILQAMAPCNILSWQIVANFIDFSLVDPSTIGPDRLANALAASEELPLPAMIIDCGTAITTEIISTNKKFCGGAIIPGRILLRKALHNHTALLPMVPLNKKLPDAAGKNTCEAISAVDLFCVGGINHLITESEKLFSEKLNIYFTGGDGLFFFENCDKGELLKENLTIKGLNIIAEFLAKNS